MPMRAICHYCPHRCTGPVLLRRRRLKCTSSSLFMLLFIRIRLVLAAVHGVTRVLIAWFIVLTAVISRDTRHGREQIVANQPPIPFGAVPQTDAYHLLKFKITNLQ